MTFGAGHLGRFVPLMTLKAFIGIEMTFVDIGHIFSLYIHRLAFRCLAVAADTALLRNISGAGSAFAVAGLTIHVSGLMQFGNLSKTCLNRQKQRKDKKDRE